MPQSSKHYATAAVKVGYSQSIWRKYNSLIQTGNFIIVHDHVLSPANTETCTNSPNPKSMTGFVDRTQIIPQG